MAFFIFSFFSIIMIGVLIYFYRRKNSLLISSTKQTSIELNLDFKAQQSIPNDKLINGQDCFDLFCNYVKHYRVTNIDELTRKLQTSKAEVIKQLREMEKVNNSIGFVNNNEYFYLTTKELTLLNKLTSKKNTKQYTKQEIIEEFNNIIKQK